MKDDKRRTFAFQPNRSKETSKPLTQTPLSRDTNLALTSGATELDTVLNAPHLLSASYSAIYTELSALRAAAPHATIKLIFETSRLTPDQITAACVLASAASLDYVKTSTGFLPASECIRDPASPSGELKPTGATRADVRLMRACCEYLGSASGHLGVEVSGAGRRKMKVKASGGVRTLMDAVGMLEAGAERLGSSGGVWIAKEEEAAREGRGGAAGERPRGLETRMFSDY